MADKLAERTNVLSALICLSKPLITYCRLQFTFARFLALHEIHGYLKRNRTGETRLKCAIEQNESRRYD